MNDFEEFDPTAEVLLKVMERLRSPDGCPWDREQTHQTLKLYLAEECAELMDAIDDEDPEAICEELGDILMNVVFNAVIAAENGQFHFRDVLASIIAKMIRRHPHVFAEENVKSSDEVLRIWEKVKKAENKPGRESVLDGIPRNLSALLSARTVQKRAARYGFDWTDQQQIMAKIEEELAELKAAIAGGNDTEVDEEIGDLLFSVVNLSRFRKRRTAEDLLSDTVRKFKYRFKYLERKLIEQGIGLEAASIEQMEYLWQEAKNIPEKNLTDI
ncbi:MAG: nucleoside triphosphate pyrophosphohydrolase [Victivallaceae bacterium]